LNSTLSSESSRLRNWLTSDDILVVDFRDSIELIEDLNLIAKMPHFLQNSCSLPIYAWYCQCKVEARVVGCCAHRFRFMVLRVPEASKE